MQLGLDTAVQESATAYVVNAIARATGGNSRLVQRLFAEIDRMLTVNALPSITTEVVAFARESLGSVQRDHRYRQQSVKLTHRH